MSMQLKFEFDVEKADELLRTLNEIKKGFGDIGKDQAGGGFSKDSLGGIKAASEQMQKLKSAFSMEGKDKQGMEDFIRLSEKAFGVQMKTLVEAQTKSMEGLKKEINATVQNMNNLADSIAKLERQKQTAETQQELRSARAQLTTEGMRHTGLLGMYQEAQGMLPQDPRRPSLWNQMMGLAGGAKTALRQAGIVYAAGLGGMASAGFAMTRPAHTEDQGVIQAARAAVGMNNLFDFDPYRQAKQGDLGLAYLMQNRSLQSDPLRRLLGGNYNLTDVLANRGGAAMQVAKRMLTGDFSVFSREGLESAWDTAILERTKRLTAAQAEQVGQVFNPMGRWMDQYARTSDNWEIATGGFYNSLGLPRLALESGISTRNFAPVLDAAAKSGVTSGISREDLGSMLFQGMSRPLVDRSLRRQGAGLGGGPMDSFSRMLGAAGLGGDTGTFREQFSDSMAAFLNTQGLAVTGEGAAAAVGAGVRAGQAAGMTTEVATSIAVGSVTAGLNSMQSGSYKSQLIWEKLRNLGLSHGERDRAMKLIGNFDQFISFVARVTGTSDVESLRKEFASLMGAFESAGAQIFGMSRREAKALQSMGFLQNMDIDSMTDEQLGQLGLKATRGGVAEAPSVMLESETILASGQMGPFQAPTARSGTSKIEDSQREAQVELQNLLSAQVFDPLNTLGRTASEAASKLGSLRDEIDSFIGRTPRSPRTENPTAGQQLITPAMKDRESR